MIKKLLSYSIFACTLLILGSCGSNSTPKTPLQEEPNGESIYKANCTACHGADGKLGLMGAKDLSASTLSREQRIEIITNGKNTMTPFGSLLSKEEIDAVAGYVQTLKR